MYIYIILVFYMAKFHCETGLGVLVRKKKAFSCLPLKFPLLVFTGQEALEEQTGCNRTAKIFPVC